MTKLYTLKIKSKRQKLILDAPKIYTFFFPVEHMEVLYKMPSGGFFR